MLKRGSQIINLEAPVTDVDKEVRQKIDAIISDYKLDQGKMIHFTYPKRYVITAKSVAPDGTPMTRIDSPASFKIQLRDIVRDRNGSVEWRWFESQVGSVEKGNIKYNPSQYPFTGSLSLGINNVDLIYYLLYIYSRTENGANWDKKTAPYVVVEDKAKEAANYAKARRLESQINTMLYGEAVGLSDETVVELGVILGVGSAKDMDPDILRQQVHVLLTKDLDRAEKILATVVKNPDLAEGLAIVAALVDSKKIMVTGVATGRKWRFVDAEGKPADEICSIGAKKEGTPEEQLAKLIASDEAVKQNLSAMVE